MMIVALFFMIKHAANINDDVALIEIFLVARSKNTNMMSAIKACRTYKRQRPRDSKCAKRAISANSLTLLSDDLQIAAAVSASNMRMPHRCEISR